jgi:hypothetical protein
VSVDKKKLWSIHFFIFPLCILFSFYTHGESAKKYFDSGAGKE